MNTALAARLARIENEIQAQQSAGVWVDMVDNIVRVDMANKRGETLKFDSVQECAAWVERRVQTSEYVTGMAFISDIKELCLMDMPAEVLTEWDTMPNKSVLLNMRGFGGVSLADMAFAAWARTMTVPAHSDALVRMLAAFTAYV